MAISSGTMKSIKMKCLLFWFVNNGSYLSSVTMSLVVCHSAPLSPIINIKFCNTFALSTFTLPPHDLEEENEEKD